MTDFANSLFEQASQITKAHGYDILAEQVLKLKECNKELIEALQPFADLSKRIPESKKGNVFGYNDANLSIEDFRRAETLINKAKLLSL
jgi:hypothetical protein